MVSRKWIFQPSRLSTLPSAAAMPPSANTVCALPSRLFDSTAVFKPRALASIAARRPAPPAPITTTSCSTVCTSDTSSIFVLPGVVVVNHAHADQAHVEIGEADPDQAEPGELHVSPVEPGSALPSAIFDRVFPARHAIAAST